MSNFKQRVEEILIDGIKANEPVQITVNAILAAHNKRLDEIAEGMPTIKMPTSYECYGDREKASYFNNGIDCCQAYIQAQKEAL